MSNLNKKQREEKLSKIIDSGVEKVTGLDGLEISKDIVESLKVFSKNKKHLANLLESALSDYGVIELASEYHKKIDKKHITDENE